MTRITSTFLLFILLFSCGKPEDDSKPDSTDLARRTVIVYISANNNLISDAYDNINKMEAGFQGIDGKLIVYARLAHAAPAVYEIAHDTSPFIRSKRVKAYPEHDSTNPEVMKQVFADIQGLYPASSYGAVLWSHATSWLPSGYDAIRLRSFGDDAGRSMDIRDLAQALPSNLDFLVFDACSMASVEVVYELKDKAAYIVASPTEVVAEGMPYDRLIADFFHENIAQGLEDVAAHFHAYYDAKAGRNRSTTVSLIQTKLLPELAFRTRQLIEMTPYYEANFRLPELQRLDFLPGSPTTSFDFVDFLSKNFPLEEPSKHIAELMSKLIVYRAHTPNFNNQPIHTFSGLSCYVPGMLSDEEAAHQYYRTLSWYNASGFNRLF